MDDRVAGSKSGYYRTPALERLASEGMRFSDAYAPHPNCSPTRMSIQTGKSPVRLGSTDIIDIVPGGEGFGSGFYNRFYVDKPMLVHLPINDLPKEEITIAEWIKKAKPGYATAHFGKWHMGGGTPADHGYDVHDGATTNREGSEGPPNPKRTPERGHGYAIGKLIAQRAFSDAAEAHGGWDAITVCPADNVGPIQSKHQKNMGPWQHIIEGMLVGRYPQTAAYRPWMTVDVRDDAECHVRLLASTEVRNGERYIAWSTDTRDVEDVCASIDRLLPELEHDAPEVTDDFPDHVKARESELRAIWAGCELRNDRMRAATGIEFRDLDTSIRDCVESLISIGEVIPRRRSTA